MSDFCPPPQKKKCSIKKNMKRKAVGYKWGTPASKEKMWRCWCAKVWAEEAKTRGQHQRCTTIGRLKLQRHWINAVLFILSVISVRMWCPCKSEFTYFWNRMRQKRPESFLIAARRNIKRLAVNTDKHKKQDFWTSIRNLFIFYRFLLGFSLILCSYFAVVKSFSREFQGPTRNIAR